jgi:hypothetical protein
VTDLCACRNSSVLKVHRWIAEFSESSITYLI